MAPRSAFTTDYTYTDHAYTGASSRIETLFHTEPAFASALREDDAWRQRPLEPHYALLFVDSLVVKVKDSGLLCNRRIHLAMGILEDGHKDIIGYWSTGANEPLHWPSAITELQQRGVSRLDIAVCEADAAAAALRAAYPARLIAATRQDTGAQSVIPLPPALRALCMGISAVESVIEKRRRRGLSKQYTFASEDAAVRSLVLALRDANTTWKVSPQRWNAARAELAQWRNSLACDTATKTS